ncbi:MAG: hypothetical protein EOO53_11120 [Gammaproteobacteria bacterium]|nr:MAG: hypothetical protein EOO53_11120 [Gammaproteobacteria bacterium]
MKGAGILLLCMLGLVGCGGASDSVTLKTFPVSVSTNQGGSVNTSQATVEYERTTSFNFTAETGYHLKTVDGCGGKLNGVTYTTGAITAACSITAVFERNTYSVTVDASAGGTFTIENAKPLHGDTASILAVPKSGYSFASFSGCGAGINAESYTTAPFTADCTVSLSFTKTAVIQGSAAEGAALVGAEVSARCSDDSTFSAKVTTDSDGKFSGQVAEQAFPCALKVTTAAPIKTYYSIANQAGNSNINLLTDLALVLASGKSSADWYASSDWASVKTTLADAQASLKTALYDLGFSLPGGDFLPFKSTFTLGGTWDKLLDQLQAAIAKTPGLTYESLAASLRNGNAELLPAPTGGSTPTAEVCFNPVIYAEGTTLKTKYAGGATFNDIYYNSERITNFTNGKIIDENGVPVLTRTTEGSLTYTSPEGGPLPSTTTGAEKLLVNLEQKNIGQLTLDTTTITENSSSSLSEYTSTFTSVGNQTDYKLAQDASLNETFQFLSRTVTPVRDNSATWTIKNTKTFKGLTTVMRKGVVYRVCDFEIHKVEDNYQWISGTHTDWKDRDTTSHQYFMLGAGVELPGNILSAVLNGQELLNGKPN